MWLSLIISNIIHELIDLKNLVLSYKFNWVKFFNFYIKIFIKHTHTLIHPLWVLPYWDKGFLHGPKRWGFLIIEVFDIITRIYLFTWMALRHEGLIAFRTLKSIYYYKVMSFGLKNVGATYQCVMQKIFNDMLHKNVELYVDDLILKSRKRRDHLQDLRMVFGRLRMY